MMTSRLLLTVFVFSASYVVGCGGADPTLPNPPLMVGAPGASAAPSPSSTASPSGFVDGGNDTGAAAACDEADMLLLLDRTLTMHQTPEGLTPPTGGTEQSKFAQAIHAIESLVAPPSDSQLRFGLMMWPREPTAAEKKSCITVEQRIAGNVAPTNDVCEGPETIVTPQLGAGQAIRDYLDPASTHICFTTPTGAAIAGAADELRKTRAAGRTQAIVLITDGADWDLTCPTPDPRTVIAAAAAEGIKTFVVGFDAKAANQTGVGAAILNDMACAGGTAPNAAASCKTAPEGVRATNGAVGAPLYLKAENATQLAAALQSARSSLGCIH